jgi:hypothetical protein
VAGKLCLLLRIAQNGPEHLGTLHKLVVGQPQPDPQKKPHGKYEHADTVGRTSYIEEPI